MLALQGFRYKLKWIKLEKKEEMACKKLFSFQIIVRFYSINTIHIKCYHCDLVLLLKCLTMIAKDEILVANSQYRSLVY